MHSTIGRSNSIHALLKGIAPPLYGTRWLFAQAILSSLGGSRAAFRGVFIVYGAFCSLWIPLSLWVIPVKALQLGQVWCCVNDSACYAFELQFSKNCAASHTLSAGVSCQLSVLKASLLSMKEPHGGALKGRAAC